MKQFEISNSVRKELSNYLNTRNLNLKAAMDNETPMAKSRPSFMQDCRR